MRIVYLHQYYNSREMPGGIRSAEMALRFARAGHEVHVITSDRQAGAPSAWREEAIDGYHVHWCGVPYNNSMAYPRRIGAFARFAVRSAARAAHLRGDVVLASSTPLTIAIPGVYAAWRAAAPLVLEIRDLWPEVPIAVGALRGPLAIGAARALERWAYRRSSHIVALSPGMREGILAAGVAGEKVSTIPNACDVDLFATGADAAHQLRRNVEWLQDRPLVLYAGSVGLVNGVQYLVGAAQSARKLAPEVRFAIIGEGAQLREVLDLAKRTGVLNDNFFVLPPVPKREVAAWFGAASIVCALFIDLPELRANSANKFFDGLAAGKPVAINYGGWQAEMIGRHRIGLVLPPGDPAQAGEMLVGLIRNRDSLVDAGRRAHVLATSEFNRDALAARLLGILEDAVRRAR